MRSVGLSLLLLVSWSARAQVPEGEEPPPEPPPATPEETPVFVEELPLMELVTPTPVATPGIRTLPATTSDAIQGEALARLTADAPIDLEIAGPFAFRVTATQYFPGLPQQPTVLDVVVDGRIAKRVSLVSKLATGPHPELPMWNVGQVFVVVVQIPEGIHAVSLRVSSGASTALGLRIGERAPVAMTATPAPTPDGPASLDTIGTKAPPNGKPELAYRTEQRSTSVGVFSGMLQPSVGAGRSATAFTGLVYRYQRSDNLGFGLIAASAIFHESIPKRRWIGFQMQPLQLQGYYHFPVGDHAQPYVVGCAGPVVARSEMFLVDDTRLEQAVGGGGCAGGGVEYDAFRDNVALKENRLQIFAELSAQAIYVPFQEHKRTMFLGGSFTFGALYKW